MNTFQVQVLHTGVLISPQPDQEGNKLQRQKILSFIYPIYNHNWRNISTIYIYTGVLISPQPDQEGNKLQRQKILSFIYPIYNHNWRNISTIYIYTYNKTNIKRNTYSHYKKKYIGKQVGLRTYQHPDITYLKYQAALGDCFFCSMQ